MAELNDADAVNNDIPDAAPAPAPGAYRMSPPRLSIARTAPDPAAVDAVLGRPSAPPPQEASAWPTPRPSRP